MINYFWIALTSIIAIYTLYVSTFTIRDIIRTKSETRDLDRKIARYEKKIKEDSIFIEKISFDTEFMERYARERYHMQRQGETVYILE